MKISSGFRTLSQIQHTVLSRCGIPGEEGASHIIQIWRSAFELLASPTTIHARQCKKLEQRAQRMRVFSGGSVPILMVLDENSMVTGVGRAYQDLTLLLSEI